MRPTNVSVSEDAPDGDDACRAFLRYAGPGLAQFTPADLAEGNLSLLFALSAWLRTTHVSLDGACSSLLLLRKAVVEVSGLDGPSEPTPLLAGDAATALVGLAVYVYGLICRGAARARRPAPTVVEQALASFDTPAAADTTGVPLQ